MTIVTQHFTCTLSNIAPYTVECVVTPRDSGPRPRVQMIKGNRIGGNIIRGGQLEIKQDERVLFRSEPIVVIYSS